MRNGDKMKKEKGKIEILDAEENSRKKYNTEKTQKLWCGTWNNPNLSDEEFYEYLKTMLGQELQYFVFQRETAPTTGTEHFQWFIILSNRHNFNFVKSIMPYGTYIKSCDGNAIENRSYCTKTDSSCGKSYADGIFVMERQRTDMNNIIALAKSGASDADMLELYPTQTFMYQPRIKELRRMFQREEYSKRCRDVEVYFYYGPTGTRKTTRILKQHGLGNCFVIDNYGQFQFDGYERESVVIFDEYEGQERVTRLNKMLEPFPLKLNIKGGLVSACYEKVYFISNIPFIELYKDVQRAQPELYNAFYRRIHHIIAVDDSGRETKIKETFFEDIPEQEREFDGLTKRVLRTVRYDVSGRPHVIYERGLSQMTLIPPEAQGDMPF